MPTRELAVEFDENRIDAIFAGVDQCHLPGVAVGIAIGGTPVYRKGFGLASMELPVVLSPAIRMRIYSTTKHFTCLAYMLLCEEGRAGIDDPIGRYLPELHPVAHQVTPRQLMGNLSGLRDVHGICWQFSGIEAQVSSAELLSLYRDIGDINAPPGTAYFYSNSGFLLLTAVIERIAGQPLEDVLRGRILEPVGMHDTLLRRWNTDFIPNSATMHTMKTSAWLGADANIQGSSTSDYERAYVNTASAGEGGIVSTVDDMLRWLAHMDSPTVGAAATWEMMRTPQILANGSSTGYGFGLVTGRYRGVDTLWHGGGGPGANSQMLKVPAAGLDVIVMANRHDALSWIFVDKILDACLPELDPVNETSQGALATGTFRSPATGRIIQLFARNGRQIVSIDGYDLPVELSDDGVLYPAGAVRHFKQAVILTGKPEQPSTIRFDDCGNVDNLVRLPSIDEPNLDTILGHYSSDMTSTKATIYKAGDQARLNTIGRFGSMDYSLECLAAGVWRATPATPFVLSGILLFEGDIAEFRFSPNSLRGLPFRRCA